MSDSMHDEIIPNGEEIVERFGGIRPMATKLNVPVTTVQGWKKRDAIPAIRRDEILSAAAHYDISLKGLLSDSVANENTRKSSASSIAEDPALSAPSRTAAQPAPQARPAAPRSDASTNNDHVSRADLRQIRRTARRTSFVTTACLLAIVAGAGFLLFGNSGNNSLHVASLENRVSSIENQASARGGVPDVLRQSVQSLQQQVDSLTTAVGLTGDQLSEFARQVAAGGGASLTQRLAALESQLTQGGNAATAPLAGALNQMQALTRTPEGAAQWKGAIDDLRQIVTGLQGRTDQLDSALQQARGQNDALGQTLSEVNGRDVGAAAMLLALTQLRTAADRETPFTEDLALLRQVAAGTDPELASSIDKLSPYAETGILSPGGLKRELQATANDIITAKISGEDVSLKEKIMNRIHNLFSIKKDGVPVAGGRDNDMIAQASRQLDRGDVQGAMATLQKLDGPAAQAAAPWQKKAEATVAAQALDTQLVQSIMTRLKTGLGMKAPINLAPSAPQVQTQNYAPQTATPESSVQMQDGDAMTHDQANPQMPEPSEDPRPTPAAPMSRAPMSTAPTEPGQSSITIQQ